MQEPLDPMSSTVHLDRLMNFVSRQCISCLWKEVLAISSNSLYIVLLVYAPGTQGYRGQNLPPPYLQSFGSATVSSSGVLDVKLMSVTGATLYQKTLQPEIGLTCAPIYRLWNANTDALVSNLTNGVTVASPPCAVNIEAVLTCQNGTVGLDLLSGATVVKSRLEKTAPYFLFGDQGTNVLAGSISAGTYSIRASLFGIPLPAATFTFGTCV